MTTPVPARLRWMFGATVVALALPCAMSATGAYAAVPTAHVTCGQTLVHSVRLANDLTNCPGDGLVIGADNITVDLNGHTLDGVAAPTTGCDRAPFGTTGIDDTGGFDGITILGGTVQQFDNGVGGGFGHSRITAITARANTFAGITIGSADGSDDLDADTIDHDLLDANSCGGGVAITASSHSTIEANHVTNMRNEDSAAVTIVLGSDNHVDHNYLVHDAGSGVALALETADDLIDDNSITDGGGGVDIEGPASSNRIVHNAIVRMRFFGIVISSADFDPGTPTGNQVTANAVTFAGDGIILFEADHGSVTGNDVTSTGMFGDPTTVGFGIVLDGSSHDVVDRNAVYAARGPAITIGATPAEAASPMRPTSNVVSHNIANSNHADGIRVIATARGTSLLQNTATNNAGDGLRVLSPFTSVTANIANGNGAFGIDAVPGTTDGGANRAHGNGNHAQCSVVVCS